MKPAFVIAGLNGTVQAIDRLVQLSVTDGEGDKSDQCDMTLDDRDCGIILPQQGDRFGVSMGYSDGLMGFMGMFVVETVEASGWPRTVAVHAKAADMTGKLKEQRQKGYRKKPVSAIVGEIAGRHGLAPRVLGSVAGHMYDYIAQSGTSDMHFLQELADKHDAVFKIANGQLIFGDKGLGMSGSGLSLGMITIVGDLAGGGDVIKYNAKSMARPEVGEAKGHYWDRLAGEERVESEQGAGKTPTRLRKHHRDKKEAKALSKARTKRAAREGGGIHLEIVGNPMVGAEMMMTVIGVRPGLADGLWRIKTATHSLTPQSYTTTIDGEYPDGGGQGAQ